MWPMHVCPKASIIEASTTTHGAPKGQLRRKVETQSHGSLSLRESRASEELVG
jgi:hypothetical protein